MVLKIKVSELPPGLLNDPRRFECEKKILADLENLATRHEVAVHEAAHAYYHRMAGANDIIFDGPTIAFDSTTGQFVAYLGRISSVYPEGVVPDFRQIAKTSVAGGMIDEVLRGKPFSNSARGHDFHDYFDRFWGTVSLAELVSEWETAKESVRADLQNPEIVTQIMAIAAQYEAEVYSEVYPEEK